MAAGSGPLVVKVGGAAVAAGGGLPAALSDVAALWADGVPVVVVHGGGPEITAWSKRLGQEPRFVDGLRYSDADTVAVAEMALARVGKGIAAALTREGLRAVSLGGRDAGVLTARPAERQDADGRAIDLGRVGAVADVRVDALRALLGAGFLPVLATIAPGQDGTLYNVNADEAAVAVAAALGARALVLATDVAGVLLPGRTEPVERLAGAEARALMAQGIVHGGMRPKVEACLAAAQAGVPAWIVDGRRPGAVAGAAASAAGAGTAFPPAASAGGPQDLTDMLELDRAYVMQTYGRTPLRLVRGRGSMVEDVDGKRYLDFLSGISVTNLGHCHPEVVAAITQQAALLGHTSNLYLTRPQAELARALVEVSFPGRVFFCNSGAEATEAALKLCRKAAWRRARAAGGAAATEVVSFSHSFHGRTYGALAVTRGYQEGFGPMLAGFRELPWNDVAAAGSIGPETAGVIVEPIQGEGGVQPAAPEFLRALRAACDRHGACLIFDEIQCGLGRSGRMFAFQHYGVRPDVVTLGKALGGGLPMGAVVAAGPWAESLGRGDHASTFGGNPIVAAAALASLEVLRRDDLPGQALRKGEQLRAGLRQALGDHPLVREVRGVGLMTGVELVSVAVGPAVVDACRERGLLINCTAQTVLRLLPPLTVGTAELRRAVEVVAAALAHVAAERPAQAG